MYCNNDTNSSNAVKNAIQCLRGKNYIESSDLVLVIQGDQMG
ncbi:MAG TPA: hypothetical protein ACHBX0_02265 [Arsenophonus sp.]